MDKLKKLLKKDLNKLKKVNLKEAFKDFFTSAELYEIILVICSPFIVIAYAGSMMILLVGVPVFMGIYVTISILAICGYIYLRLEDLI